MKKKETPWYEKRTPIEMSHVNVALEVLKRVRRVKFPDQLFYVTNYMNGREIGFCIVGWTGKSEFRCSFSENRNSDDIVVYDEMGAYPFPHEDGWSETNTPSDSAYRAAHYFDFGAYDKAAEYIISRMNAYVKQAIPELKALDKEVK